MGGQSGLPAQLQYKASQAVAKASLVVASTVCWVDGAPIRVPLFKVPQFKVPPIRVTPIKVAPIKVVTNHVVP